MKYGPLDLGGLTVGELAKRVWNRLYADAAWDTAAELGFYFMLALLPLVLFLVSLGTVLQVLNVVDPLMLTLRWFMPPQAYALLATELARISSVPRGDLLTFGAVTAVWSASSGVEALLNTLNRAYEVRETRNYLMVRGTAMLMTLTIAVMIIVGGALLFYGDRIAARAAGSIDRPWAEGAVAWLNYVLGFVLMVLGIEVVYYYGPNVANQKWRWVSPGSLAGVALFVLASAGFSLYVRYSDSYNFLYGSIGAVIILLFWLYILGLALLTGGEINAQIAASARAHGQADAPMVGVEGEPPKPDAPPAGVAEIRADDDPVRALIEAARRERGHARAALVAALGAAGPAAEPAVRDLAVMLCDEHPGVRAAAVAALERVGGAAAGALPALRKVAKGDDAALCDAAARTIAAIEAAATTPGASPPPPPIR